MFDSYRRIPSPMPVGLLLLVAGVYLLTGIAGHDPWKSEDAIHIGIAYGFSQQNNWLFPHVAGEPWLQTAPLYHWLGTLLAKWLDGLLAFHNAVRLATAIFGTLFLVALTGTARALHDPAAGSSAPLLAIGTLGMLQPLHEAQPAVAGLAFAALAYWGCALWLKGQSRGIWMMGLSLGLAFPADGLTGLLSSIPVLLALIARRDWKVLFGVLCLALPLGTAWPWLAYQHSPALWEGWWKSELSDVVFGRTFPDIGHLEQIGWTTWPVLPLMLWSLWLYRHEINRLLLPLTGLLLGLAWYLSGPNRPLSTLQVLFPMILLAAAGVDRLRRGAANAFDWFGLTTFTVAAGLLWLGASAQALEWPPRIAHNFDKLAPGHQISYPLPILGFALTLTLLWLMSWRMSRISWRPALHWGAGMALMWGLVAALWLPWLDHGKSYRQPALALKAALPKSVDCIERIGITTAHRASLDYFAGIRTVPVSRTARSQCHWRLSTGDKNRKVPEGWTEYWRGQRPSDRDERWYLDKRKGA